MADKLPSSRLSGLALAAMLAVAAGLSSSPVRAEDEALSVLARQGQYWQAQGDTKRAAEAWQRVLKLDKGNERALRGLVETAMQDGQFNQAQAYLKQLKTAHPRSAAIAGLEQSLKLGTPRGKQLLQEARTLAKAGKTGQAVEKYKALFGDTPPAGALAREYYNVLGYTEQGETQAVKGLRQLESERPGDKQLALELAQHLIREEKTRPEGIERLQQLAAQPGVGEQATQSWRQALTWMGADNQKAQSYFKAYLAAHPDDQEIADTLEKGREALQARTEQARRQAARAAAAARPDPLTQRARQAVKAMDDGHIDQAKSEFLDILAQRPSQTDALGGLGVILLREGDLEGARTLLKRAARADRGWAAPLRQAESGLLLQQAERKRNAGNGKEAIKLYQSVLRQDSKNAQAYRGLIHVYLDQGDTQSARRELGRLEKAVGKNDASAQAVLAETRGSYYFATHQLDKARTELENALVHFPSDPWVRYQLARIYLDEGRTQDAQNVMHGLLRSNLQDKQVITANALFASEMQDWAEVRRLLDQVPPAERNSTLRQLASDTATRDQLRRVGSLCDAGRTREGLALLSALSSQTAEAGRWLGDRAGAYIQCGQPHQALSLIDEYSVAHHGPLSSDMTLQRAGILMQIHQEQKAYQTIQHLNRDTLTPGQRRHYDQIAMAMQIQKADLIREQGRYAAAYDVLAPLLQAHPDEPPLVGALARLYASAGQKKEALALYQSLQGRAGQNPDLNLDVARLALQTGETAYGKRIIGQLIEQQPNDVNRLVKIARLYRETGHSAEAADIIKRAMALEQGGGRGPIPAMPARRSTAAPALAQPDAGLVDPDAARSGLANPFQ